MKIFLNSEKFIDASTSSLTLSELTNSMLNEQVQTWDLARKNYTALNKVETKTFIFGSNTLKIQFNPERKLSSSAKIDAKSIEKRKCFLCKEHLPDEQTGVVFGNFLILTNPFPIFPKHLTIAHKSHTPQRINGNLRFMLELSKELQDFHLFYNGPKCGASAPDHMHFQAGKKGLMPIEHEYSSLISHCSEVIFKNENIKVYAVHETLRKFISIESGNIDSIEEAFNTLYHILEEKRKQEEPMQNILCQYDGKKWILIVFPRENHRPTQYYESGEKNILLSPASVDFGGCCITPLKKDFEKISQEDLRNIFKQVSVNQIHFNKIVIQLKNTLNK